MRFKKFSNDLLKEKFDLIVIALSLPGIDFIGRKLKMLKVKSVSLTPKENSPRSVEESTLDTLTLKVVTFNVYYKNFDNLPTLDAIGSFDADIVALQETNDKWQKPIEKHAAISKNFKYTHFAHDKYSVKFIYCNIYLLYLVNVLTNILYNIYNIDGW